MVHPARSSNRRAQRTKTGSKISPKWSIQHAWPVRDVMTRVGVMIEADAIRTDMHHQGAGPEAFPGSAHLAQLASVHVPVSSATIQTPLELPGATRRQSNHAFLLHRAQGSSAPARACNPQASSFGARFRHRSRQQRPERKSAMLLAQELTQVDELVFAVNTSLAVGGSGVTLRGTLRYLQLLRDTPQAVP